jgi:hypothetical protein
MEGWLPLISQIYIFRRLCYILRGPAGERILDIVPGGTELKIQLRRGVGKAARTLAIIPMSIV